MSIMMDGMGGLMNATTGYSFVYPQYSGSPAILPESEVFLKTRRLEFIKLLDAVLDASAGFPKLDFMDKHLNSLTELELAAAIRGFKFQLKQDPSVKLPHSGNVLSGNEVASLKEAGIHSLKVEARST